MNPNSVSKIARNETRPVIWCDVEAAEHFRIQWPELDEAVELLTPDSVANHEDQITRASIVVTRKRRLGRADMESLPVLEAISCWGVGTDHVDVDAATSLGLPVMVNPVFTTSVAEAALTMILAVYKRLPQLQDAAKSGRDVVVGSVDTGRNREIHGKTLGIVGYGRIGRRIGELAASFGMSIQAFDPHVDPAGAAVPLMDLDDLLATSDAIVLAAALTDDTRNLIGPRTLPLMKRGCYLINVGRGGLVDEVALLSALEDGTVAGAGLDVWAQEPLAKDNPLLALPQVIGTSHNLARSHESLANICESITSNIRLIVEGRTPNHVINPSILEKQQ